MSFSLRCCEASDKVRLGTRWEKAKVLWTPGLIVPLSPYLAAAGSDAKAWEMRYVQVRFGETIPSIFFSVSYLQEYHGQSVSRVWYREMLDEKTRGAEMEACQGRRSAQPVTALTKLDSDTPYVMTQQLSTEWSTFGFSISSPVTRTCETVTIWSTLTVL
jgi:hypothetical protein